VELAKERGYSQSFYGGIRRLPYLLYCNGKDEDRSRLSNFESISVNSYIQNLEGIIMLRNINKFCKWIKDNNLKTKIFTFIHDAGEFYVHKDEVEMVNDKLEELFNEYFDEYNGIKLSGEGNIADYYLGHNVIIKDKITKEVISTEWKPTLWDMGFDPKYYMSCIKNNKLPEIIIEK
jgi:DNA polymerase I-like protein with 3'-5' exonuclease and polymerase domains